MEESNTPQNISRPEQSTDGQLEVVPSVVAQAAPPDELIDIEYFKKIKLRVARVEAAEAVPKSKRLLKLQVDLGTHGKRQVLAGIAQFTTPEAIIGKQIVIVANLKPAQLMGLESQGMMLAAGDETIVALLAPDREVPPGSSVR